MTSPATTTGGEADLRNREISPRYARLVGVWCRRNVGLGRERLGGCGPGSGGGVEENTSVNTQRSFGSTLVRVTSAVPWANGTSTPLHSTWVSVQALAEC